MKTTEQLLWFLIFEICFLLNGKSEVLKSLPVLFSRLVPAAPKWPKSLSYCRSKVWQLSQDNVAVSDQTCTPLWRQMGHMWVMSDLSLYSLEISSYIVLFSLFHSTAVIQMTLCLYLRVPCCQTSNSHLSLWCLHCVKPSTLQLHRTNVCLFM